MELVAITLGIVTGVMVTVGAVYTLVTMRQRDLAAAVWRRMDMAEDHLTWAVRRVVEEPQVRPALRGADEAVARRSQAFLTQGPKAFYYLSEEEVRGLYSQIFREVEPSEVVRTTSKAGEMGLALEVGPVRPGAKRTATEGFTVRYEPEQNLSEMYNKVERDLLKSNQVLLCLEDFCLEDLAPNGLQGDPTLQEFHQLCQELQAEQADIARIEQSYVQRRRQIVVDNKLGELSGASGFVLMRGSFAITASEAGWRLEYAHPVASGVRIVVHCGAAGTTQRGKEILSSFPTVNAAVFGQVVGWEDAAGTLSVAPIAVY